MLSTLGLQDRSSHAFYPKKTSLEITEDRWTADTLLATGVVQVEQFCSGFDGMIPLSVGGAWLSRTEKDSAEAKAGGAAEVTSGNAPRSKQ